MDENMALTPYETREILFYKTDSGDVKVEILLYQENLWLTQAKMAELFEVQKAAISKHLKNIFASGELMEASVVSVLETTAADGKNYSTRQRGKMRQRAESANPMFRWPRTIWTKPRWEASTRSSRCILITPSVRRVVGTSCICGIGSHGWMRSYSLTRKMCCIMAVSIHRSSGVKCV